MKEAVEGLARHVVVEIEALRLGEGNGLELSHEGLVLMCHPHLAHALVDDRPEGGGELVRGLGLEVVGGGSIAAAQDLLSVVESHARDGFSEDLLGRGGRPLRRPVHAQHELVDLGTVADGPQPLLHALELLGHEDPDGRVAEVAIGLAGKRDRLLRGDLEGLLQSGARLAVGDAAAHDALEELLDLR